MNLCECECLLYLRESAKVNAIVVDAKIAAQLEKCLEHVFIVNDFDPRRRKQQLHLTQKNII